VKKRVKILLAIIFVCALIAATFLLIPGKVQRDIGIGFGRFNDRVLIGTIALIGVVVLSWKVWREKKPGNKRSGGR